MVSLIDMKLYNVHFATRIAILIENLNQIEFKVSILKNKITIW